MTTTRSIPVVCGILLIGTLVGSVALTAQDRKFARAAMKGDLARMKELVAAGQDPRARLGGGGETALFFAAWKGKTDIVSWLLEVAGEPDTQDNQGRTALWVASDFGHAEVVRLLLEAGANPNIPRTDGTTALMRAAKDNHAKIAQLLLGSGAWTASVNNEGKTAQEIAVDSDSQEVAALLKDSPVTSPSADEVDQQRHAASVNRRVRKDRLSFRQGCPSDLSSFIYMGSGKSFEIDIEATSQEELLNPEAFRALLGEVLRTLKDRCANAHAIRVIKVFVHEGDSDEPVAEAIYRIDPLSTEGKWSWQNHLYVEKMRSEFMNVYGVEIFFPTGDELVANPFRYDGKKVAFPAIFRAMETSTIARFSTGAGDLILTGVALDYFTLPNQNFYIAGRVAGKANIEGVGRFTALEYLGVYACAQENCRDVTP